MKQKIQVKKCQVIEETRELILAVNGRLSRSVSGEKLRLSAVFRGKETDRHFPLSANCMVTEEETVFMADARIQLEYVFFEYQNASEEETVSLDFEWCDPEEGRVTFEPRIFLNAELFEKRSEQMPRSFRIYRGLAYGICTLFLPLWMLDGYFALKGYKKLHPAAAGMKGKKAILYHAHGIVSDRTGYGYSVREMKTNYFRKQYDKACRKQERTEGILFLSERRVEQGGNLDLVRKKCMEENFCEVQEFLETRPVHKLKRKELRRAAGMTAKARVIILEDFYPQLHFLSIRPETGILQMWHACGAFKLFGLSDLGRSANLPQSTRNHRNYDMALASSEGIVPFYSEAYGVPEDHIRPIGVPRTDIFFRKEYREQIREKLYIKYPECREKKVVLFAPTFRGSGNKTAYFPVEKFPVDQIMESLPEDVVLVVKNHPFVRQTFSVGPKYQERVLDLSADEMINDLLFITSLLITDYSSSVFEAALLNIPMLFYVFDLEEYLDRRDLYFDFASFAPGEMVRDSEELPGKIRDGLDGKYGQDVNYEKFREFFLSSLDGHSTERTMELIRDLYYESEHRTLG